MNSNSDYCSTSILVNSYSCKKGLCNKIESPVLAGIYIISNNLYNCVNDDYNTSYDTVTCKMDSYGLFNGIFIFEDVNTSSHSYKKNYKWKWIKWNFKSHRRRNQLLWM